MEKALSRNAFPEEGMDPDRILEQLSQMQSDDIDWRAGRSWSMVYYVDDAHLQLLKKAHHLYFSENTINPYAFRSVRQLERDVTRMAADLLHGDTHTVGTFNSGGTESIFMAIYTYRERARREGLIKEAPEMIVPASIHPAFYKAAHILGIRLREIPLGKDLRADVRAMEAAINKNTICLAASAPAFPYGLVDPLPELSAIAEKHRLPLHVDACVGGFMLPWVEELGYPVPEWDFRLPGVTSISADLHKFGYGSKGASLILYRSMEYLKYQFYILTDWCGGIYVSPSFMGTRSCGPVAAAWAALRSLGREGYLGIAREVMDATVRLRAALEEIPEIKILGTPHMNLLAFTTHNNKPDIFVIGDQLEGKGWMVDRQQRPNSIHLMLMKHNIPALDEYLSDLKEAVAYAKANPGATSKGNAALYGLMTRIPFRGMVEQNVRQVFEDMYGSNGHTHTEMQPAPAWQGWLNWLLAKWKRR